MDVFRLRQQVVEDYASYSQSFVDIRDPRARAVVDGEIERGLLWPDPLLQLNPAFERDQDVDGLVAEGVLHPLCAPIFRAGKEAGGGGRPVRFHRHQVEAIRAARTGRSYVLTTGTGSGKSLAYIVPIVDHVLREGPGQGIRAIVVYPMNALANSQLLELEKFICAGFDPQRPPVRFERYTGQESDDDRRRIQSRPPDILLTNYVMLELILTRTAEDGPLVEAARGLRFLVLDELHTYRGRQGADVALLVRRVREHLDARALQCVGTSATLAGPGTLDAQRREVAAVATRLFGAPVRPEEILGETLRRQTERRPGSGAPARASLAAAVEARAARASAAGAEGTSSLPRSYADFVACPLAAWVEATFGLEPEPGSGRLVRSRPKTLAEATRRLVEETGATSEVAGAALRATLLEGARVRDPETGAPVFAFRLHQFLSRGDTVYATLEDEATRYLTVRRQTCVPDDPGHALFPLVFCRACGQDYACVRLRPPRSDGLRALSMRELRDRLDDDHDGEAGFLYRSTVFPWPSGDAAAIESRLPDEWFELVDGARRLKRSAREHLPRAIRFGPDGVEAPATGLEHQFVGAPFRFCLTCGVSYSARASSDFGKLGVLGSEGRSTATTIQSLATVRRLRAAPEIEVPAPARKLLSFTDNRQDASLQAGHLNDFVEVALLRSALYRACAAAGGAGLTHDVLTERVFQALALPVESYALDPQVRFLARTETDRALQEVLGYRIYRDLERGWRITSPNLEQTGLLRIAYRSLDEAAAADDLWQGRHAALVTASPAARSRAAETLLDHLRRSLAIRAPYLQEPTQQRIRQLSFQRLREPWAIDDRERLELSATAYPRSTRTGDFGGDVFVSARGAFGQFLRRPSTFPALDRPLSLADTDAVIRDLFEALREAGILTVTTASERAGQVHGYQVSADALLWLPADGTRPAHDPLRTPTASEEGGRVNRFFAGLYREVAPELAGLRAREHTAQVPSDRREEREQDFRSGALPLLYCSPTMELGIDIATLQAVHLRNVPPTPANYAQRSGRAGRSGQPALVLCYCAGGSSHDQWFFRRPEQMVRGAVAPPRIDLANEDLIRAHVHAIWLTETGASLGRSLADVLDLNGTEPTLALQPHLRAQLEDPGPRRRARERAARALADLGDDLTGAGWHHPGWLDLVLEQGLLAFERACDRWRGLYRAAIQQMERQNRVILDASRSRDDRNVAQRLRAEAEAQRELLLRADDARQSDFYSYRYFASEGFLPGYNFPRLPLSAFIPGRRTASGRDEFLQRPRFLAISEFGPRATIYHEGSRYQIVKAILPPDRDDVLTSRAKICARCGYLHEITEGDGPDLCERPGCGAELRSLYANLFRLQNVATRRQDRITSDEEERLRLGYEIRTAVRFAERSGRVQVRTADLARGGERLASLTYGDAATLQRVNLGWARRKNRAQQGFVLDVERGIWQRNDQLPEDDAGGDEMSQRCHRVIPFVQDARNCLLFEPASPLSVEAMASLEAALKRGIQGAFDLEEQELASEPLPDRDDRRLLLFYEAAEGGAGVLRQLVEDRGAFATVCERALEVCHFTSHATGDAEVCAAACYDCLMSYGNQRDHDRLDRRLIEHLLRALAEADTAGQAPAPSSAGHLAELRRLAGSSLERAWLDALTARGLRLPTHAQARIESCDTRPDFLYADDHAVIYVDGPPHDFPERQARDRAQTTRLEDAGYDVIRFSHAESWDAVFAGRPGVFGAPRAGGSRGTRVAEPAGPPDDALDEPLDARLASPGERSLYAEIRRRRLPSPLVGEHFVPGCDDPVLFAWPEHGVGLAVLPAATPPGSPSPWPSRPGFTVTTVTEEEAITSPRACLDRLGFGEGGR